MISLKKFALILLGAALAVSAWGCASSEGPQDTTLPPETTLAPDTTAPQTTVPFEEVTDPTVDVTIGLTPVDPKPGFTVGTAAQTAQLRVRATNDGWQKAFDQENGCLAVVSNAAELQTLIQEKLSGFDLDMSKYDEAFFAENRLALIPRSSNSGSVTYEAKLQAEEGKVHIELDGKMPQIGTADMAQWLVLVTLPNADYAGMTVTAPAAAGNPGTVTK